MSPRRNIREEARDPYAAARVRLADGTELSGSDGLQVWLARREQRAQEEACA